MLAPRDNHLDKAWSIAYQLLHGRLTLDDVAKQAADSTAPALQARVDGMLRQLTAHKEEDNESRLKRLVQGLTFEGGRRVEFAQFQQRVGAEIVGLVFTAHPTFSLSTEANDAALGLLRAGSASFRGNGQGTVGRGVRVRRATPPTLQEELDASTGAIRELRRALRRALRVTVDVAAQHYPADYRELRVRLFTIATWVGFDLDGRTDIGWSRSLSCRYQLALAGLDELAASVNDLGELHGGLTPTVADALATITKSLDALRECFAIGLDALGKEAEDATRLGRLNRLALEKLTLKQDAIGAIDASLAAALATDLPLPLAKDLLVLRSEWEGMGLGIARLHFRLNSVQLHNAIRPEIRLDAAPGKSQSRRHFLAEVTRLLDDVKPVNVHYGTVAREQTTAKRVFMLAAQFQKHFDGRTPIRLLIAESDTPFTLLAALYYARLFGVERHVEISPLFETADGLHHGDRVISELLDNTHFLAYVRAHGRFCVQLGFSDSGRYIGQPAASLAVERFKLRLIRLWQARGLGAVQLLFFDTHGESIGRGAHPRSLPDRFLYTHSREVRARLAELAAPYKHEVSFQGGEGYLWFATERTAFAVLTDLVSTRLEPGDVASDALYGNSAWALDFFLTLKDYQERARARAGVPRAHQYARPESVVPDRLATRAAAGGRRPRGQRHRAHRRNACDPEQRDRAAAGLPREQLRGSWPRDESGTRHVPGRAGRLGPPRARRIAGARGARALRRHDVRGLRAAHERQLLARSREPVARPRRQPRAAPPVGDARGSVRLQRRRELRAQAEARRGRDRRRARATPRQWHVVVGGCADAPPHAAAGADPADLSEGHGDSAVQLADPKCRSRR